MAIWTGSRGSLNGAGNRAALAADLRSRSGKSSGASGGGRGSRPGGLAAGTAPERFGADRNSATVEKIEAEELYAVFDPVGLDSKWSIGEV